MSARPGADVPYPKATEARKPDTPGRARYKPSNHCAGNVGLPPLNLYARVRISSCTLHTRPRVQRASGIPCALSFREGQNLLANLGQIVPRERRCISIPSKLNRPSREGSGRRAAHTHIPGTDAALCRYPAPPAPINFSLFSRRSVHPRPPLSAKMSPRAADS